jgi:hypothetical protein
MGFMNHQGHGASRIDIQLSDLECLCCAKELASASAPCLTSVRRLSIFSMTF